MAISSRQVQNKRDSNGVLTGKPGTVYDVNIKYNSPEGKKTYSKKGFATKKEAAQHEAEMKVKLSNPVYTPVIASQGTKSRYGALRISSSKANSSDIVMPNP